jgi:regulator of replication initiation timing
MPLNADVQQALMLLGLRTLELEQIRTQCELVAEEFNKVKAENEELKKRVAELIGPPGALREVSNG